MGGLGEVGGGIVGCAGNLQIFGRGAMQVLADATAGCHSDSREQRCQHDASQAAGRCASARPWRCFDAGVAPRWRREEGLVGIGGSPSSLRSPM